MHPHATQRNPQMRALSILYEKGLIRHPLVELVKEHTEAFVTVRLETRIYASRPSHPQPAQRVSRSFLAQDFAAVQEKPNPLEPDLLSYTEDLALKLLMCAESLPSPLSLLGLPYPRTQLKVRYHNATRYTDKRAGK
jgi:hypothetical protein